MSRRLTSALLYGLAWFYIMGVGACSRPVRIDCDRLERRLVECAPSFAAMAEKGRGTQAYQALFTSLVHESVTSLCKLQDGRFEDAAEIEKCMKASGCEAFARCIVRIGQ